MGARIVVHSGISAGAIHWVERNVVRIGSQPTSDMVIPSPSVDAHALTVEFRQTEYHVYNRSSAPVVIGSQLLQPGQHMPWADADLLQIQNDVTLALELDADPSPAPQPVIASDAPSRPRPVQAETAGTSKAQTPQSQIATSDLTAEASSGINKTTLQWAITGACVLGCILLLAREQFRSQSETDLPAPAFETVVRESIEKGAPQMSQLVDRLQLAEAAYIRGQTKIARERFRELHDTLKIGVPQVAETAESYAQPTAPVSASPSDDSFSTATIPPPSQLMQQFVEHRLRQIGS